MKYVQINTIKDYKPMVIKYLALLIGVCYLANPLQSQISGIFHEISHIFESPDNPIGHSMVGNSTHHYHEHSHIDDMHEHQLIDLLDSIFVPSDESSPEKSALSEVKFDKHISTDKYLLKTIFSIDKHIIIVSYENSITKGYSRILEEPPQDFSL